MDYRVMKAKLEKLGTLEEVYFGNGMPGLGLYVDGILVAAHISDNAESWIPGVYSQVTDPSHTGRLTQTLNRLLAFQAANKGDM